MKQIRKMCAGIIVLAMILAVGCTQIQQDYALNMATVTAFVMDLKAQYSQVEVVVEKVKPNMTETQRLTVDIAKVKFRDLIAKLDGMSKLENYRISTYEMSYMWNTVISERDRIKEEVVRPNWEKFDVSERYILKMFDDKITKTDFEIKELMANPTHDNLSTALNLMSTGLMFGMKILGVGVAVL